MTDKEQIIINGVDVMQCENFYRACMNTKKPEAICHKYKFCSTNPNCYFKQLARKTQEYEELKEENQQLRMQLCNDCGERDDYNIPCKMIRDLDYGLQKEIEDNDRYRKALEKIEKVINNILNSCLGRNTAGCRPAHNVCGDLIKILDIINKAQEESL